MIDFDPHLVLSQCCPNPLTRDNAMHDVNHDVLWRLMSHMHCGTNKGFYFQPIIVEMSFKRYAKQHVAKPSYMLTRWQPEKRKCVALASGDLIELPLFYFYIVVNRDAFPPQLEDQNTTEWYTSITPRTKAIAHELLYADQYAKYFDPEKGVVMRPIEIPNVDQEDEVLCPSDQIEALLHDVKVRYGETFSGKDVFLHQQATSAVQYYYHQWLIRFGVERDVCHRRTAAYLDSGLHRHHQAIPSILKGCLEESGIQSFDPVQFKDHMRNATTFAVTYANKLKSMGCDGSNGLIAKHTLLAMHHESNKWNSKH